MTTIIIIPGPPTAKQSTRFARGRAFMAPDVEAYSARVAMCARQAGCAPVDGAVSVRITAVKRMPASWSAKRKARLNRQVTRPDVDNLAKAILDPLIGIAYHDDRQVVELLVRKEYGARDEVVVRVAELEDGQ